jgi:hypothetical protein
VTGRLVFRADAAIALEAAEARVAAIVGPVVRLAVGWATVDLERATRTAIGGPAQGDAGGPAEGVAGGPADARDLADDELLGARCRLVRAPAADGAADAVILLEATTEGRLAATLARHGEGPAALYVGAPTGGLELLRAAPAASEPLVSRPAGGPFGPSVLVLGGPVHGPHLIVADGHSLPSPP